MCPAPIWVTADLLTFTLSEETSEPLKVKKRGRAGKRADGPAAGRRGGESAAGGRWKIVIMNPASSLFEWGKSSKTFLQSPCSPRHVQTSLPPCSPPARPAVWRDGDIFNLCLNPGAACGVSFQEKITPKDLTTTDSSPHEDLE